MARTGVKNRTRVQRRRAREAKRRREREELERARPGLAARLWQGLKGLGRRERPPLSPEEYVVSAQKTADRIGRTLDRMVEVAEREAVAAEAAAVEAEQERIQAELDAEERRLLAEHRARLTSHRSVLELAMRADPGLVDAYLVYADWLQEQGDPYGDLISVQHRLLQSPESRALQREEGRLLQQLGQAYRPWPRWDAPRERS